MREIETTKTKNLRRQVEKLQETVDNINNNKAQADAAFKALQEELDLVRRESEAKNRALQEQLEKSEQRIARLESVTEQLLHLVHTLQAQPNVGETPSVDGKTFQKTHIDGSAYSPLTLTHHRPSKPWMDYAEPVSPSIHSDDAEEKATDGSPAKKPLEGLMIDIAMLLNPPASPSGSSINLPNPFSPVSEPGTPQLPGPAVLGNLDTSDPTLALPSSTSVLDSPRNSKLGFEPNLATAFTPLFERALYVPQMTAA